jgi:thiol-disulfide isomerase/thioredoxin
LKTTSPHPNAGISPLKVALITFLFAAYATFSVLLKNELRKEKSPLEQLPLGRTMPDFTLLDTNGKEYTLSKIAPKNKVILIDFWATWCVPCRMEMPELEGLNKADAKKGLLILAIDEDREPGKLDAYLKQKPVGFPVLLDPDGKLAESLGIRAFPTTILVSARDTITAVFEGLDQYLRFRVEGPLNAKISETRGNSSVAFTTVTVDAAPEKKDKQ